jgi:V/A-type H+-transporting ATPase subunit I
MFGMMFGDIGHGAVIILMGILLRNKISGLMVFTTMAGISSIVFGFLYGSLFGYEHIIHPLWMSPMQDPNRILLVALAWGICFLIVANLLSIYNLFALNQPGQAVYSSRGIVGLLFFLGCIFAGYQFMANQQFAWPELLAIFLPLSVILFKQWQHLEGNLFEKLLVVAIEGLDNVINTLSSTLSFLRIAAFSLNHVALAAAVFTLANMMDSFGHWVTIVLGNIFIIVLEGGIVAIQCLRLEYYEGFSRFFSGKGQRFKPLKIESQ